MDRGLFRSGLAVCRPASCYANDRICAEHDVQHWQVYPDDPHCEFNLQVAFFSSTHLVRWPIPTEFCDPHPVGI